jgi:hypothetical protein
MSATDPAIEPVIRSSVPMPATDPADMPTYSDTDSDSDAGDISPAAPPPPPNPSRGRRASIQNLSTTLQAQADYRGKLDRATPAEEQKRPGCKFVNEAGRTDRKGERVQ